MTWKSTVSDVVYLNFAVREDEVNRLLPPGTSLDTRLHRGETWGFFSLVLFRHDSLYNARFGWPSLSFPQANLRVYVKDTDGSPAVYFKRMYMPRFYSLLARWFGKPPVSTMNLSFPGTVHSGGEYRWRLTGRGAGNISGKIESAQDLTGNLTKLFENPRSLIQFFRDRPLCYYGAGVDTVYRIQAMGSYSNALSFRVKEWELGFLADDLERHNFPEAFSANFFVPNIEFEFDRPSTVPLAELSNV